jgi:hypothetical protein
LVDDCPYQPTPFDEPKHIYKIKAWSIRDGIAVYECYESDPLSVGKEPKDKDILRKVDEGTTSFKKIPIICFQLDEGIAVGKKLAPLAAEHFNRTTIENHSTNRACLTVPVVYRGDMLPDGGGLPSPSAMDMNRGQHPRGKVNNRGVVELGSYTNGDRFEIVEAEGRALGFIHAQNEDLDEKMHSVVHQMGQSLKQSRSQSGKTGLSKQEDRRSTEMLLTAIADEVFSITERLFRMVSESRGEDIVWDVKGLSPTSTEDRDELVKEVALLPGLQFPSITFKKEYFYRISSRLIEGTDQRTLQTIRKEIESGLDSLPDQETHGTVEAAGDLAQQQQQEGALFQAGKPLPRAEKAFPQLASKDGSVPAVNSPGGSDANPGNPGSSSDNPGDDQMAMGPFGQPLMPEGAHLQTGEHIDAKVVHDQLAQDYQDRDIEFVLHIPWIGPVEVPLSSVDFSNKDNWQASEDDKKVDMFADKMANQNYSKPIVLVNNPSNDNKMMIVDGHHRALAALQNGQPVNAYVGQVGSTNGPWDRLHSKQVGSKQASLSSNQKPGIEMEKEISRQVDKSAKAVGGKTK